MHIRVAGVSASIRQVSGRYVSGRQVPVPGWSQADASQVTGASQAGLRHASEDGRSGVSVRVVKMVCRRGQ